MNSQLKNLRGTTRTNGVINGTSYNDATRCADSIAHSIATDGITGMETSNGKSAGFRLVQKTETNLIHSIHFRRPDTPYSLSKMTAPNEQEAAAQIQRLKALGYTVTEVVPPLANCLSATSQ